MIHTDIQSLGRGPTLAEFRLIFQLLWAIRKKLSLNSKDFPDQPVVHNSTELRIRDDY
jgi:hypothetical protein